MGTETSSSHPHPYPDLYAAVSAVWPAVWPARRAGDVRFRISQGRAPWTGCVRWPRQSRSARWASRRPGEATQLPASCESARAQQVLDRAGDSAAYDDLHTATGHDVTVVFPVAGITTLLIPLIPLLMLRALLTRSAWQRAWLRSPADGFAPADPIRRAHSARGVNPTRCAERPVPGLGAAPLDSRCAAGRLAQVKPAFTSATALGRKDNAT